MRPQKLLQALCCLLLPIAGNAQFSDDNYREPLQYGIYGGGTYSRIDDLETTILSEPFFINYTLNKDWRKGIAGGLFLNYRGMADDHLGMQFELGYSQQGSDLNFTNTSDFNYKIQFKYQYLSINTMLKGYPWDYDYPVLGGFNVTAGFQLGFNVATHNLVYTSWGAGRSDAFGSDMTQQQQLRNVLKGKNSHGLLFGIGYEFRHFMFDARYTIGLTDVVETQVNSYNFIENKNRNTYFNANLSYTLPF